MRIISFCVENFRNLRFAEYSGLSDFVVICGSNGCGKSALLEALMTAKERVGAYGHFSFDPRAVSADSQKSVITMNLEFTEDEQQFVKNKYNTECTKTEEITVTIDKSGSTQLSRRSNAVQHLLSYYSHTLGSPGFFDYINAYRYQRKSQLQTWEPSLLSDDRTKQTLALSENKFQYTKQYLTSLKMHDLQVLQKSGGSDFEDSLEEIRQFFDLFFTPMKFKDVIIYESPFKFIISTPSGDIDIDDLSSGEKEVLNVFIRFHQLKPKGAIILFDEADAHLHPDLERRYLALLRGLGQGNQLLLTTHSPEMMIDAGTDALYTLLKEPPDTGKN